MDLDEDKLCMKIVAFRKLCTTQRLAPIAVWYGGSSIVLQNLKPVIYFWKKWKIKNKKTERCHQGSYGGPHMSQIIETSNHIYDGCEQCPHAEAPHMQGTDDRVGCEFGPSVLL
jgi:hypothetical protein